MVAQLIDVVCLVLQDPDGAILATQRPKGKRQELLWEFPGGKVEPGEDYKSALIREIDEELRLKISNLESLPAVEYEYDFSRIRLLPFLCLCEKRPSLQLIEHADSCWIFPENWQALNWAPADIPVLKYLVSKDFN